jgi:diguanylate cyclase (GGDEF)-like protein
MGLLVTHLVLLVAVLAVAGLTAARMERVIRSLPERHVAWGLRSFTWGLAITAMVWASTGIVRTSFAMAGASDTLPAVAPYLTAAMTLAIAALGVICLAFPQVRATVTLLTRAGRIDALTRLPNRRGFDDNIGREEVWADRKGTTFSVVMIDLDHFDVFNTRYGRSVGDEVLTLVATLIAASARRTDTVSRLKGGTFGVLLPETDEHGAEQFAEKCRKHLRDARVPVKDETVRFTASVGVANGGRADDVVRIADNAMHAAKFAGRDRIVAASRLGRGSQRQVAIVSEESVGTPGAASAPATADAPRAERAGEATADVTVPNSL